MSHKKRSHQNHSRESNRESKRAQFTEEQGTGRQANNTTKVLVVAVVALIAVVAYLVLGSSGGPLAGQLSAADSPSAAAVSAGPNGELAVPLSQLGGRASHFEYRTAAGKTVRFFAMRTSDGVYRAALDACHVCFDARKGYYQDGDEMVCKKCDRHFSVNEVNNGETGCHPMGLTRRVEVDKLVLKSSELEAGAEYF